MGLRDTGEQGCSTARPRPQQAFPERGSGGWAAAAFQPGMALACGSTGSKGSGWCPELALPRPKSWLPKVLLEPLGACGGP